MAKVIPSSLSLCCRPTCTSTRPASANWSAGKSKWPRSLTSPPTARIASLAHCRPFGSRYGMKTIVDSSLAEDEEIVFAADTHQEAIRMPFDEYDRLEQPMIASFAIN